MKEYFVRRCKEVFKFLEEDYGFKIAVIEQDIFDSEIIYKNQTTAVKMRFESRENQIFISLYRLINGQLPIYRSLQEYDGDFSNNFSLDDIIFLKSPSLTVKQGIKSQFTKSDIETILLQYAHAMRQYTDDVLKGDFTLFKSLGELLANRIREYKQKATKRMDNKIQHLKK